MKINLYVLVKCFSGLVKDVTLYTSEKEANKAFKEYTGVEYDVIYGTTEKEGNYELMHEDYDQTKIFVFSENELEEIVQCLKREKSKQKAV